MIRLSKASRREVLSAAAHRLTGAAEDFNPLLQRIGDAPLVLLGEATHGTHEFYAARAQITRRLIEEKGYMAIAIEADWPDAYRVHRFIQGRGSDTSAQEALSDFRRFPQWMWRNREMLELVQWLREHNAGLPPQQRVGIYGLDLYSLYNSVHAVIEYLEKMDPEAAQRTRQRYACFDHSIDEATESAQEYGYLVSIGARRSCEDEAVAQLVDLRRRASEFLQRDGWVAQDEQFYAEQNARLVANAERYYRAMFGRRTSTWNLRDQHMADTLDALVAHLKGQGKAAKVAVWEHNSHLGDASATERARVDELNVGQLVRERYDGQAVLVGFTTHHGTVSAASEWGGRVYRKRVRPALAGSYEALLHETGLGDFLLLTDVPQVAESLQQPRLERAIGVIYRPETERLSHYFEAQLADQFDAVLHYDETRAVEPLEADPVWHSGEVPETFPFGV